VIGALLGDLVVWFVRHALLAGSAVAQRLTRWSPEGNLAAVVGHGDPYVVPIQRVTAEGVQFEEVEHTISLLSGLSYGASSSSSWWPPRW